MKAAVWRNVLSPISDSLAVPSPCYCLSPPMSPCVCVSVSCTRLRGVSTPQTSPEHTWVPHGCSIKVFSLLKGMYLCSELMEERLHEPVVTNIFFFFFCCSPFFPIPAFFLALCISLFIFYSLHFPPYFSGFVYSARSVCGVAMRLMRTRFPLLPGSLIWRRCIPAALQSRYNSGSWCRIWCQCFCSSHFPTSSANKLFSLNLSVSLSIIISFVPYHSLVRYLCFFKDSLGHWVKAHG